MRSAWTARLPGVALPFLVFYTTIVMGLPTDSTSQAPRLMFAIMSASETTVTVSPTSLVFPTRALGTASAAKTVTLENTGTTTLTINSIDIVGTNPGDFLISATTCGTSLAAGASCTVKVKFKPTKEGTRSGLLSFTDDGVGSPQQVTLSGVGTAAKLTPTNLSFGDVVLTFSHTKSVTLENVGTTTFTISGFTITGTNASEFSQTNNCGTSLDPGANCKIDVTFGPTVLGKSKAVLNVSDGAAGSPQNEPLSGTGVGTLTGNCIYTIIPLLCGQAPAPSACPSGQPVRKPVRETCSRQTLQVDEARSCTVEVNGQIFHGLCQWQ